MTTPTQTSASPYGGVSATTNDLADFVGLSAALTGIDGRMLHPALDTHGTAQTYLDLARSKGGATFPSLMAAYSANKGKTPAQIATAILEQSGDAVAYLARSVMLLWYLASWYDPTKLPILRKDPPPGESNFVPFTVVSADAYTQSWVWRVGQTHPMGYSEWEFGYWHAAPPPLADFIGTGGGTPT